MLEKLQTKDIINLTHCFIQLGVWVVQDALMLVDDNLAEFPDE